MVFEHENIFWEEVSKYKVNLFLGAGFSVGARNIGGNKLFLGKELRDDLVKRFSLERLKSKPLPFVSGHLKRNKKGEFNSYIKDLYTINKFDEEYTHLGALPLENIFTINVDDLIEKVFHGGKLGQFVVDSEISGYPENPGGVSLFKLYGSVTYPYASDMKFSYEELANAFRQDHRLWQIVQSKVASHPTLFWGINFEQDGNMISTICGDSNLPSRPKWAVVLPGADYDVDADELRSMGINIIRATTSELLIHLGSRTKTPPTPPAHPSKAYEALFPYEYIPKIIKGSYPIRPISFFYQGFEPTWEEIISNKISKISFYNVVLDRISKSHHVHLGGSPGSGRTTLLKQLAVYSELSAHKFYFSELSQERAEFFVSQIIPGDSTVIFLDNLQNNLNAYLVLKNSGRFKIITAEMDVNYEKIKHKINAALEDIIDISDLPDRDIQLICEKMNRPTQRFTNEKVSLFEIVYRLWASEELRTKIAKLLDRIAEMDTALLEFYALLAYMRYCSTSANMSLILAYYSDDPNFTYTIVYDYVNSLASLVDISTQDSGEPQDSFTLRSNVFAKLSIDLMPSEYLKKVLKRFHGNVHKGHVQRFDVFRIKAYDADLTRLAFISVAEGIEFYEGLMLNDTSVYIKHQYALYLHRKGKSDAAWEQIDAAYTQSGGRIFSIANTHAMILFENNINRPEDSIGTVRRTLERSFEVLENCLRHDFRKSYHLIHYANQAIKYAEKYNDNKAIEYLTAAIGQIDGELKPGQYLPFYIKRTYHDIRPKLIEQKDRLLAKGPSITKPDIPRVPYQIPIDQKRPR